MRNDSARINMKIQQKRRKLVKIATEFWMYSKKNGRKFHGNVQTNNGCSWLLHFDTFDDVLAVVKDGEVVVIFQDHLIIQCINIGTNHLGNNFVKYYKMVKIAI